MTANDRLAGAETDDAPLSPIPIPRVAMVVNITPIVTVT